jgi:glycosyltransferase involved in cell wall biosynthesis
MRIAIFTEYYPDHDDPASGVYVHLRAAAYRATGHIVQVFRVREGPSREVEYGGIPIATAEAVALRAAVESFAPDVAAVHTPYPGAGHTRLAESIEIPTAFWIHGYEAMITAFHGYHRGLARVLSLFHDIAKLRRLRRSIARADAIVYVSQWMRRTAERSLRYRHPRTHVIPNPVDTERFRPQTERQRGSRLRGLALRGLNSKYGLDLAVEAYGRIGDSDLTIVGTGPDADRLLEQIQSTGAPVELEQRRVPHDDVPALINRFDYFVAPARTEAQGVAMCEAMACGLPVAATRAGGIPEFVREGEDGYLARPGSAAEFRRAVLDLIDDPQRALAMGRNAREHVLETCSAAVLIPRELELLSEIAE